MIYLYKGFNLIYILINCNTIFPGTAEAIYVGTGGGRTFGERALIEHFNCSDIDVVTWMCRVFFDFPHGQFHLGQH